MTAKPPPPESPKASGWGPVSRQVAANVLRFRTARGISTTRLSAALKEIGHSIPATGITRIEKGERRVDTDDLVALALALNISPLALLLPTAGGPDTTVELTQDVAATGQIAWSWADGLRPVALSHEDPVAHLQRFQTDSRPPYARPPLLATVPSDDFTEAQKAAFAAAGYVEAD